MTQILIDAMLRSRLKDLKQPLELCDESGKVVARMIPVPDPSQYEPIEPHISVEELQRRRQEPDFSTREVLDYLEKL